MKIFKYILIASGVVLLLCAMTLTVLDSGWVLLPKWYAKTDRYKSRSLKAALYDTATAFELMDVPPSEGAPEIYEEKSERWGTPVQYGYEEGKPTLRAAGRDRLLNTKDDIVQKVALAALLEENERVLQ